MTPANPSNPPPRFRAATVYVGSQSKDLLAIDLETGKLRWKYRATDSIGESSPAVYEGIVYVGDLAASCTP